MRGSIHSDERCSLCESKFKWDGKTGLYCPNHSDQQATSFVVRFGKITNRFKNYELAQVTLDGFRHEVNHGKFDIRDYRRDEPLGFENLTKKWLKRKKVELKPESFRKLKWHIAEAVKVWGNMSVKSIQFPELEDFLCPVDETEPLFGLAGKTRHNVRTTLNTFFSWCEDRGYIAKKPKLPVIEWESALRETLSSKQEQLAVLAEIKRLTYHFNPKVWLKAKWCSTYYNTRPGEFRDVQEKHIDRTAGRILVPHPKEKRPKSIPLTAEDLEILRSIPRALDPEQYFFTHRKGNGGAAPGSRFGKNYMYNVWKRACKNLGISGVDFYGGTRHSTMQAERRKGRTPEEIKRTSGHRTDSFDNYLAVVDEETRPMFESAQTDNRLITDLEATGTENGKDFK